MTLGNLLLGNALVDAGSVSQKPRALGGNHPKLKRSDLADLIHCSYLPYSDIFSVDGRTRKLIADGAALWGTQLIEDTRTLPEAIRTKAQLGGQA
jgi:hypothetical protein